jgi:hypothetical protein
VLRSALPSALQPLGSVLMWGAPDVERS